MQAVETSSTARDNFIKWLFERFNVPESRRFELKEDYVSELPLNCDFRRLKKIVETKWRTPYSVPFAYWFKPYIVVMRPQLTKESLYPEIEKIRADKAFFKANFEACQEAKEETMDVLEKIYGRRPGKGRRQSCS